MLREGGESVRLANQEKLDKQKRDEAMKDGWIPADINGIPIHITPNGGTCAIENIITLRSGETCIVTTTWRVDTDGAVWKRPVLSNFRSASGTVTG